MSDCTKKRRSMSMAVYVSDRISGIESRYVTDEQKALFNKLQSCLSEAGIETASIVAPFKRDRKGYENAINAMLTIAKKEGVNID